MATKLQAALIAVAQGNTPDLTNMSQTDKDLVNGLMSRTESTVDHSTADQGESLVKIRKAFSPKKNGAKGDWLCMYYRLNDHTGTIHSRDGRDARSATLYGATRNNLITVPEQYKGHDIFYALYIGRKLKTSN